MGFFDDIFVLVFATPERPKSRIKEGARSPTFDFDRFFALCFAEPVLQNDMFCQAVDGGHHFPAPLESEDLRERERLFN